MCYVSRKTGIVSFIFSQLNIKEGKILKKLLFICFFSQILFAQVFENAQVVKDNGQDQIIVSIRFDSPVSAYELLLNPRVPFVLESVQIDDNELWLKRTDSNVEDANVIGWFQNDSALVVHNNANVLNNSLMTLHLIADSNKIMRASQLNIQLREMSFQNNTWQVLQDQKSISKNLPLRKKDAK